MTGAGSLVAGVPIRTWTVVLPLAAIVAVGSAVSPLGVLLLAALLATWAAAGHGLGEVEGRWVSRLLAVAIVARVLVVAAVFLSTNPAVEPYRSIFPDGRFVITRSLWIRDYWMGGVLAPDVALDVFDPYGGDAYFYFFAWVQYWFGAAPFALNLVTVLVLTVFAAGMHRLVRHAFGRLPAFIVLVMLLFVPTLFAWSVSMLKDIAFMALLAMALGGAYWMVRGRGWARPAALVAVVLAVASLGVLREGGVVIGAGGVGLGLAGWLVSRRPATIVLALVLVAAAGWAALSRPSIRDAVTFQVQLAASRHIGHVFTEGYAYRLLDPKYYALSGEALFTMQPAEMGRFLMRAVASFFVVPTPWQVRSLTQLAYVPEQVMWYCLLLLAVPGTWVGLRRDALLTWLLIGGIATAAAVIAPNSGNVGTLIRHREMVLPLVGCLGAVGVAVLLDRIAAFAGAWPAGAAPRAGLAAGANS
ncbi:MAG: hypothetical protein AB7H88_04195 [Vicinamibacterales bacterium]